MTMKRRLTFDRHRLVSIGSLFVLLFVSIPALAQLPNAIILGVVKDTTGSAVPGAMVVIRNTDIDMTRTMSTGDDGA